MITLETGLPGAGKTLYCIEKLLLPLVGATVKHENSDGVFVDIPRTIYTNINGLLIEHEKIGPEELNTWHLWAKPGSVIVYDEIQKPWPLVATGSKVPACIEALETHRHMGVDFVVITQHPMLIHANLTRLVSRHLHVRRMGNMGLAVVYEWDSCSRTLLYKNSLTKSPWKYSKKVQSLYKSAELHTKQPRRIPSLVYFILFGIIGLGFAFPQAYATLQHRLNPSAYPDTPIAKATTSPSSVPKIPMQPTPNYSVAETLKKVVELEPKIAGCAAMRDRCDCYDTDYKKIEKPMEFCIKEMGTQRLAKATPVPESLPEYQPKLPETKHPFTLPPEPQKGSTLADVAAVYR